MKDPNCLKELCIYFKPIMIATNGYNIMFPNNCNLTNDPIVLMSIEQCKPVSKINKLKKLIYKKI